MATTDSRTGFRLPWSTDRAASREASADPADGLFEATPVIDSDGAAASTPEPGEISDQDATGDGVRAQEEEPVTILAPDTAQHPASVGSPAPDLPATGGPPVAPEPAPAVPSRRPTKFLADLTRAMQTAAEQARSATLEQYRAEGTSVIEQIHGRSATGATELRRHADDDVSAIKDWSKAEISRIREETERRIASRREQLEGQLERHAAIIEHEIEKVRGRVSSFEVEMGTFFDELLGEDDPAVFAARAASLPEPPSFEDLDDDAIASLLHEPGVGVPEPVEAVSDAEVLVAEAAAESLAVVGAPAEADAVSGEAEMTADAPPVPGDPVEGEAAVETETVVETEAVDATPLDQEAAMAAIQAAAEAAASLEAAEAHADRAEFAADRAEAAADAEATAHVEVDSAAAEADVAAAGSAEEAAAEPGLEPAAETVELEAPGQFDADVDPRLAMLGLSPDFAAAEMAAAEAAAAEVEEVPEIGSDALAARLSGLVPGDEPAPVVATVTTQVVVTGLVSVASIASFKRHIGRLVGVAHVGVSSGPDGEFLFAVEHDPETSLRELIPTLPGFGARVVGAGDEIVHVSAQDPQD